MKRLVLLLVLAGGLSVLSVASAGADPGGSNPKAQHRSFSCDDGNTYSAGFVGVAPGNFYLDGTTSMFVLKVFTEYTAPGGELIATFNYGIPGFDPSELITCSYSDPAGIYNVFSGFITPRA
jgi:hypothetical protein